MAYQLNRKMNARGSVEEACLFVEQWTGREAVKSGGKHAAVKTVASECRVPFAFIRKLLQPSRRPKTIATASWMRLHDGYLRYCRAQISALEKEIARVEALDPVDHDAARALVDHAKALVDRLTPWL
jgi:hypothetical protein